MDVMLEGGDAGTWRFRRDESVHAPAEFMIGVTGRGVRFLKPHGVLLFKAKAARPKDAADFALCVSQMEPGEREWLRKSLEAVHPGHPWMERLT